MGFRIKFGKNICKETWNYTASTAERVDDLNEMLDDDNVRLVFFGGGYGSVDLLPHIDYRRIKEHPKLFLSYSVGTSILDAIHTNTGITTYYGQTRDYLETSANTTENNFFPIWLKEMRRVLSY